MGESILLPVAATLIASGAAGGVAILWRTVVGNRDDVRELKREALPRVEHMRLEARVDRLEADKVTVECVREVIEEALDKRELAAEKRREERAKRYELQTRETVREEIARALGKK